MLGRGRLTAFEREVRKTTKQITVMSNVGKTMGKSYGKEFKKSEQAVQKFGEKIEVTRMERLTVK